MGRSPRELVDGPWPDGNAAADAPVAVHYAQEIAVRLSVALEGKSVKAVAEDAGLARSTVYDIVGGKSWADIVSLAQLEVVLGVRLWPTEAPDRRAT